MSLGVEGRGNLVYRDSTGRSEGIAKGKAESVLALLAARGIKVNPKTREQILACQDIATLDGAIGS